MISKALKKYLANYVEQEARGIVNEKMAYESFCIIPIYDEPLQAILNILETRSSKRIAYIFVFNAPEGGEASALQRTREALAQLQTRFTFSEWNTHVSVAYVSPRCDIFVVDRCSDAYLIPKKQGVGLARKIGADIAVSLASSQPSGDSSSIANTERIWLHNTDADVSLPDGYFDIPEPERGQAAVIYPFEHAAELGLELPMQLYDFKLLYYQAQLRQAGSPYAFFTIGSTMTISAEAYVQARGFPKRAGGEDFYLLNKLAKLGSIDQLMHPKLIIKGRASARVPFGTGPALKQISDFSDPISEYRYYHPRIFFLLGRFIEACSQIRYGESLDKLFDKLGMTMEDKETTVIQDMLVALKFDLIFSQLILVNSELQLITKFHTWFDGFLTLKFVHALRDRLYANVTIRELYDMKENCPEEVVKQLEAMEFLNASDNCKNHNGSTPE